MPELWGTGPAVSQAKAMAEVICTVDRWKEEGAPTSLPRFGQPRVPASCGNPPPPVGMPSPALLSSSPPHPFHVMLSLPPSKPRTTQPSFPLQKSLGLGKEGREPGPSRSPLPLEPLRYPSPALLDVQLRFLGRALWPLRGCGLCPALSYPILTSFFFLFAFKQ